MSIITVQLTVHITPKMKGKVQHFGKYACLLSCRALYEKIDWLPFLGLRIDMKLQPG